MKPKSLPRKKYLQLMRIAEEDPKNCYCHEFYDYLSLPRSEDDEVVGEFTAYGKRDYYRDGEKSTHCFRRCSVCGGKYPDSPIEM